MPALHSFADLLAFLEAQKIPHRVDAANQLVELPNGAVPPLSNNLFVRWEKTVPFVNILQFLLDGVPADRVRDLETAIVRLDNVLEVGGFGFDHSHNRLYLRLSVPAFPQTGVEWNVLDGLAAGVVKNAREFIETFKEIVGGKPGDQVTELYRARKAPPAASS